MLLCERRPLSSASPLATRHFSAALCIIQGSPFISPPKGPRSVLRCLLSPASSTAVCQCVAMVVGVVKCVCAVKHFLACAEPTRCRTTTRHAKLILHVPFAFPTFRSPPAARVALTSFVGLGWTTTATACLTQQTQTVPTTITPCGASVPALPPAHDPLHPAPALLP